MPYVHLGIRTTADENGYVDPESLLPVREAPPPALPPTLAGAPVASEPAPAAPAPDPAAAAPDPAPAAGPAPVTAGPCADRRTDARGAAGSDARRADAAAGARRACARPVRAAATPPVAASPAPAAEPAQSAEPSSATPQDAPPVSTSEAPAEPAAAEPAASHTVRSSGPPDAPVAAARDGLPEPGHGSPSHRWTAATPRHCGRSGPGRGRTCIAPAVRERARDTTAVPGTGGGAGGLGTAPANVSARASPRSRLVALCAAIVAGARRAGRRREDLHTANTIDGDALLRDDTHLLRELDASHRPRVHDDRGRHPRAPSSAARRGDVLSHGSRRARGQGGARRRRAGALAEGVRRQDRRRLAGAAASPERVDRLLHQDER